MKAEDDVVGAMIEDDDDDNEIRANGDTSQQRHRPIISSEQLDVEAYAALYAGRTKISRLLFIAEKCSVVSMEMEALRMGCKTCPL